MMEPILKSDVFFFISSVSVVIITILLIVILFRLISLLDKIKSGINIVELQIKEAKDNFVSFKDKVVTGSFFVSLLKTFLAKSKNKKSKKKKIYEEFEDEDYDDED